MRCVTLCEVGVELGCVRLTFVGREARELVDVLARVLRVGDAEAELEVEALQQLVAEEVPLDHPEVVHRLVAHCELHPVK